MKGARFGTTLPPRNLPIAPIFTAEKVSLAVSREKDRKSRINYPAWDDVKVAQLDEVLELRASSQRVEGWIYPLPGGGALTPLKNEDPPPDPPRFHQLQVPLTCIEP